MFAGPQNWASLRLGDGVWVCWGLGSCCFLLGGLGAVVPPSCSSAAGLGAARCEPIYVWSPLNHPIHGECRASPPDTRIRIGAAPAPLAGLGLRGVGESPKAIFGVLQLAVGSGLRNGWRKEHQVCVGVPKTAHSCATYTVNQMAAVGVCTCGVPGFVRVCAGG